MAQRGKLASLTAPLSSGPSGARLGLCDIKVSAAPANIIAVAILSAWCPRSLHEETPPRWLHLRRVIALFDQSTKRPHQCTAVAVDICFSRRPVWPSGRSAGAEVCCRSPRCLELCERKKQSSTAACTMTLNFRSDVACYSVKLFNAELKSL